MVFTSSVFLFLFLPIFLAVYHLLPSNRRTLWILIASYLFYGWWRIDFLVLFIATTAFTYLVGRGLVAGPKRGRYQGLLLTLGVAGNLATLAYFKYFNFGVESLDSLLVTLGGSPLLAWQVILPIGISFYVFQSVSYLVDIHRGDASGSTRFVDMAAYIALFPQLIAGPIVRFKELAPQLESPVASFSDFSQGSLRFMIGFCKKVLVADMVAPLADAVFSLSQPTAAEAALGALAFAVQLFFDFSGYSDMAIGLARMMGLRLLENFAMPYRSRTITEFWQRWHISLSRWLRDYLYIPLGGNRRGRRRTYVNLMLVMLLGGLWHGAAWTFVLWGAWHGLLLVGERLLRENGRGPRLPRRVAVARTFLFVALGWITFRADGIAGATAMYSGLLGVHGMGISPQLAWQLPSSAVVALAAGCLLIWLPAPAPPPRDSLPAPLPAPAARVATAVIVPVFLLGVLRMVADSFSPFLYFRF
ncbi:MAG TPA: MBOAT family O-acyltransferase [Trueperaceae bacterium]